MHTVNTPFAATSLREWSHLNEACLKIENMLQTIMLGCGRAGKTSDSGSEGLVRAPAPQPFKDSRPFKTLKLHIRNSSELIS